MINPIYCGKIKHKTELFPGQHEAIIDDETFLRVQAQLRENSFNRGNRMPSKHGGLLNGLIRCPTCNVAMVHNTTKRKSRVYRCYTCVRAIKSGRRACECPSLPAGEMEAAVADQIRIISRDEGIRSEIIRQAMASTEQGTTELEAQKVQLTRQLNRDHSEIRQLVIHKDPNQSITHRIADVQLRIEGAERSLAKVSRELADWEKRELSIQEIEEAIIDFDRIWESLTTREKAQLLALVVSKVEFDHGESTIAISFHDSGVESLEQQPLEV
ncbi:hypothetical protein VN12_00160 [Pirellula sp. SH-Sr6A]|uniref:recombinase zinc beta ribbon domain-containing protein n=1 Tax=Pirellula sp. SH-Sr6A TaxID=1632865 RepID=UPI00078E9730|nr:recombinase zinc beta ribbon domain-containing protein [Pirellula sp. SH-Sr6A]AMV30494.1 hypothetical protein VN12_00160 [Pirellula sp. SH-Sr6A]